MKNLISSTFLLAAGLLAAAAIDLHAQGSLTPPPGLPAPVMKSLDQIEPRISINALPGAANGMHVISQPGNYYLTADIVASSNKHGILVAADNVIIDLNQFTILGTGTGAFHGITLADDDGGDGRNLVIRNGTIRHWGISGVEFFSYPLALVEDLEIRDCKAGINVRGAGLIRRCRVYGNSFAYYGISANAEETRVEDCLVRNILGNAARVVGVYVDSGTVTRCEVRGVIGGDSVGIQVLQAAGMVSQCRVDYAATSAGTATGISADSVRDCVVLATRAFGGNGSATGIAGRHVTRCTVSDVQGGATSGGASGIAVNTTGGLVESCQIEGVTGAIISGVVSRANGCTIAGNTVSVATSSGSDGILVAVGFSGNRVDGNTIRGGNVGISLEGTNNIIVRNFSSGATASGYDIAVGNQSAGVISADNIATAPAWANFSQ